MTRMQFLKELEQLLQDVATVERVEALKYYEDYFEDAGPENEEMIMKELGSPSRIAGVIKRNIQDGVYNKGNGEYTERGYIDADAEESEYKVVKSQPVNQKSSPDNSKILIFVILGILTFPIWSGGFGVIVGAIGTAFGILFACTGMAIGFSFGGIGCLIFGAIQLFIDLPEGVLLMGIGFLLLGLGILFIYLSIWLWGTVLPEMIKWLTMICKKGFDSIKGVMV